MEIDLEKEVYHWMADSMGIPFFGIIAALTFGGVIYYISMNILAFITFNTKIKRKFYKFLWWLVLAFWGLVVLSSLPWKFTCIHIILDLYYLITIFFIIYTIGYNKE